MNEINDLLDRFFDGVESTYWASVNDGASERDRVEQAVRAASGVDVGGVESIDLHPLAIMALYDAYGDSAEARELFRQAARDYLQADESNLLTFTRWMQTHRPPPLA
jgi:hypothetical protein